MLSLGKRSIQMDRWMTYDFTSFSTVAGIELGPLDKAILISTHSIPYQYKKEKHPKLYQIHLCLQPWVFSSGTRERVLNSRGKRAISVRATEGLLYCGKNAIKLQVIYAFVPCCTLRYIVVPYAVCGSSCDRPRHLCE